MGLTGLGESSAAMLGATGAQGATGALGATGATGTTNTNSPFDFAQGSDNYFEALQGTPGAPPQIRAKGDAGIGMTLGAEVSNNNGKIQLQFGSGLEIQKSAGGNANFKVNGQGGVQPGQFTTEGSGNTNFIWMGTGAPSDANGSNGDYYFREDGGAATHIYFKASGTWSGII